MTAVAVLAPALVPVVDASTAMGGRLVLRATTQEGREADARHEMRVAGDRVRAWAAMLTRRGETSDLVRLNRDPRPEVPVGPTLAAALAWARDARELTGGIVDPTLLDARLAAEGTVAQGPGTVVEPSGRESDASAPSAAAASGSASARSAGAPSGSPGSRSWDLRMPPRSASSFRTAAVVRAPGVRFDLDGVAKGWIADRALALTARHPGAIVDADGDIAVRLAPGETIDVAVDDPREDGRRLAVLTLAAERGRSHWGVATSGTSVHRWRGAAGESHHLIDPRTGLPATTDVIQCTAIAGSARVAEALAKTAVVLGAAYGLDFLDRAGALGAILLLSDGRVVALPRTTELLA